MSCGAYSLAGDAVAEDVLELVTYSLDGDDVAKLRMSCGAY